MYDEAANKATEFLKRLDASHYDHMRLETSTEPPLLVYENGENFIALDPAHHRFFIDKGLLFSVPLNFIEDVEVSTRVDRAGKAVMDKARSLAVSQWILNTTL